MPADKVYIPPIKIQGIKTKMVPLIKPNVALSHKSMWIEPFMGSGVVGFNTAPSTAVFADTNPHIIEFYNQVQEGEITSHRVRDFLEKEGELLSKYDGDYYYEVRERFNRKHEPLDFLFLNRSCFNGMIRFNKDFQFNVPYGHKPQRFSKAYITKIVNQVAHIEYLLQNNNWSFLCQSFEQTIKMADHNSFIYCDPPYIGRHVDYYDSWNENLEISLCKVLTDSNAKFMLSTWDHNAYRKNEYIEKVWPFCNKVTQEHFYHVGAKETNRKPVVEALLTNYAVTGKSNKTINVNGQVSMFDVENVRSILP
ncbi:MAG: DNA adenine methylase [Lachnospiraceae bacterium]